MSIESRLRQGLARNSETVPVDVETSLSRVTRQTAVRRRRRVVVTSAAAAAAVALVLPPALRGLDGEPAPVATDPRDLVGSFTVQVDDADTEISGQWTITFEPDGRLVLDPPPGLDDRADTASYAVSGGVLETNALVNSDCQTADSSVVGAYTWARQAGLIRFSRVRDDCAARRALFASVWEPAP
jgi:hypothetical protein